MTPAPRSSTAQLLRYSLIGVATNAAGYLLFLLVTWLGVEPKAVMTSLYLISASLGYLGNRAWAFSHRGSLLESAVRYAAAHLGGYLINLSMLIVLADGMGFAYQWVQAAAVFVVAGFLFLAFRFFVFPQAKGHA